MADIHYFVVHICADLERNEKKKRLRFSIENKIKNIKFGHLVLGKTSLIVQ